MNDNEEFAHWMFVILAAAVCVGIFVAMLYVWHVVQG